MMKNWMSALASHYEMVRHRFPDDKLIILFDIDGTILDMRHMLHYLFQAFDRSQGTTFFQDLPLAEIDVHENDIAPFLQRRHIPSAAQEKILAWYELNAWSSSAMMAAHRPFGGVLEVIRWFQMQPQTYVGLNTARPEFFRADTLQSLNHLGREYKVDFKDELLYMRPDDWTEPSPLAKVAGVNYFQQAGYHVFAFIDNEPDNLEAIAQADPNHEILLLHADTIFMSQRSRLPGRAVPGKQYDLTELVTERTLPQHIQFVWNNLNDRSNLAQFLASDVYWGEFDIRIDPTGGDLIVRHDSFQEAPLHPDEAWLTLGYTLDRLRYANKGVKLDLKAGGPLIDRVLDLVVSYGYNQLNLWFNGSLEHLQESGFRKLALAHPGATLQCPINFLAPMLQAEPARAKLLLDRFQAWGLNRFAIDWRAPNLRHCCDQLEQWGFEIDIYNVPDLQAFLQAVLLRPQSITSDFDFPQWYYYGRGPVDRSEPVERVLLSTV